MDMETIYRLYFRDVYLFLQGLTRSETLAEELTQEPFFKARRKTGCAGVAVHGGPQLLV